MPPKPGAVAMSPLVSELRRIDKDQHAMSRHGGPCEYRFRRGVAENILHRPGKKRPPDGKTGGRRMKVWPLQERPDLLGRERPLSDGALAELYRSDKSDDGAFRGANNRRRDAI